jgi:DNA-binding IclR family transcriptional regulator
MVRKSDSGLKQKSTMPSNIHANRRTSSLRVQVIARAAKILHALEGKPQGLSLGQIAKLLDLPRPTVQRIVAALDAENFVIAASPTARVRLGPALARLGRGVSFELADIARPYLEKLAQDTEEAVDLGVLDGTKAVFIDHIEGIQRLQAVSAIGVSFPLHCTATGKAILAALDDETLARMKSSLTFDAYTPNSIRQWKTLEAELREVRQTGIAYDKDEHMLGVSAVASAIFGQDGEIGAISIPIPSVRFHEQNKRIANMLRECQSSILRALGFRGCIDLTTAAMKPNNDGSVKKDQEPLIKS